MGRDLLAAGLSAIYVLLVLGLAEWARKRGMPRSSTRKIVHVGIGCWVVPTFLLFSTRWWAAGPAAGFVLFNALSFHFGWLRSMEGERRNIGTIVYPFSVALLLLLCWEQPWPVVGAAGVLMMALGDAAASIVGRRFGRHVYHVAGHPRTLEGSVAMLAVSWLACLISFAILGNGVGQEEMLACAVAALVVSCLEAVSLYGLDNVLVPLGGAATLWLLHGRLWS